MSLFRTILVAADFSESSREALRVACCLTHDDRTRLIVLHVLEDGPDDVRDRLRAAYVPDRPLDVAYDIAHGDAAKTILAVALETGCELIVLGTHGRTGWSRVLAGSVAESVLRQAHCPVLAVRTSGVRRGQPMPETGAAVRTIVHPTDLTERSRVILPVARALARDCGARLLLLHVVPTIDLLHFEGPAPIQEPAACETELQDLRERLEGPDLRYPVEIQLRLGDPAAEILRAIEERACDLVLLGTHGRCGLTRLLLGSVAEEVLRRATCPVLIFKTPTPIALAAAREVASLG